MIISPETLTEYLPRQRWFGAKDREINKVEVADVAVLRDQFPMLVRMLADVALDDDTVPRYQLLVGVRAAGEPAEFLRGSDDAVLGAVDTPEGAGYAYDAVLDHELGLELLREVAPGEEAQLVRLMGVEQSNTSLVYDDRLVLKVFRRLADGPNPDVEVTTRLAALGFEHVAEPVASLRVDGRDLAVVQRFLAGGVEGWSLALTSLRDLFALRDTSQLPVIDPTRPPPTVEPASAGGDFAAEAERLGVMTAELHEALARAFGRHDGDVGGWSDGMAAQLARANHPDLDRVAVARALDRLRAVGDAGPAIRIHGDYHLGQVLRTDTGWYVLDFEGEPARPLAERQAPSSPLRDVAGMLRSFHYAAQIALRDRDGGGVGQEAEQADGWERRNREAFLNGYVPGAVEAGLVPRGAAARDAVLAAFELDKAVYELAYEMAHRPDWVEIPLTAISRILEDS